VGSNSEIQGYKVYPMLYFHRKFSSSITMSFANSLKKGHYFLNFENKKQKVIKPTYAKGSLWLSIIEFTNSLCAHFTCMTTGHVPIGEYRQRFFLHLPISCPCGEAEVQI